jgi:hypothetical protein
MGGFGLPLGFRVSVGLHEHNQHFLAALAEALQEIRSKVA